MTLLDLFIYRELKFFTYKSVNLYVFFLKRHIKGVVQDDLYAALLFLM